MNNCEHEFSPLLIMLYCHKCDLIIDNPDETMIKSCIEFMSKRKPGSDFIQNQDQFIEVPRE